MSVIYECNKENIDPITGLLSPKTAKSIGKLTKREPLQDITNSPVNKRETVPTFSFTIYSLSRIPPLYRARAKE